MAVKVEQFGNRKDLEAKLNEITTSNIINLTVGFDTLCDFFAILTYTV